MTGRFVLRCKTALTMTQERPVLYDAAVECRDGVIVRVDSWKNLKKHTTAPVHDVAGQVLTPGLVNGHSHLELSHMTGKTVSGQGFAAWVRSLLQNHPERCDPEAMAAAARFMRKHGVAHVADISTRHWPLCRTVFANAGLSSHVFAEYIGFGPASDLDTWLEGPNRGQAPAPDSILSIAGHALYSTSPERLQAAKAWCAARGLPFSLHLAEHTDELEMLATGAGELANMLRRSILPADYKPPGLSPVAYADQLGLLDQGTLAVHAVHVNEHDARILADRGVTICLCPKSNAFIGVGTAPIDTYRKLSISLCLGTDSLASNTSLDLWSEARMLARRLLENYQNPCTLTELVGWMTVIPARTLGIHDKAGSLAPGQRAAWSCVPDDLVDSLPL